MHQRKSFQFFCHFPLYTQLPLILRLTSVGIEPNFLKSIRILLQMEI